MRSKLRKRSYKGGYRLSQFGSERFHVELQLTSVLKAIYVHVRVLRMAHYATLFTIICVQLN